MRHLFVIGGLLLALGCGSENMEGQSIRRLAQPLCGLPSTNDLLRDAVETPEGHWDFQSWLAAESVQTQLPSLRSVLRLHEEQVLGVVPDHVAREVVIVVANAGQAADDVMAGLEAEQVALPMRIQPACNDISELRAIQSDFESREWPDGTPAFAAHLDTALGQYVVTLNSGTGPRTGAPEERTDTIGEPTLGRSAQPLTATPQAQALALDIQAEFGSMVDVRWGPAGVRSRLSDGQPHFGAAGIGNGTNFCTAGFVVNRNGVMGAVTVAHCFPTNGTAIKSGTNTYGVSAGRAPVPTFDLTRIDPAGQQFSKIIHTDPGAPVTRTQVGKADPGFLDLVCVSGMVTGAKCGIEVLDNLCAIFNPGLGTTTGLTRGVRVGVTIGQDGDSGAPVYQRSGASGAIIMGLESGGAVEDEICFHPTSVVETQLGVTVAL